MLPTFLIIGARKSGTTSLWEYLRRHPDVYMPDSKDIHFFSDEPVWSQGVAWYEQQFDRAGDALAVGEAAPGYTNSPYQPEVPARIADVLPDIQLIYLVRHPIERMVSEYVANLGARAELFSFRRNWESDPYIERALRTKGRYLERSRYAMQIERYLRFFPRERLLVIKSEDLKDSRGPTLERVFRFLSVDSGWIPSNLEEDFNTTRSRKNRAPRPHARTVSRGLRLIPGYRKLSSAAPRSLKKAKYRLSTKKLTPNISISDDVRQDLEERLRPDIQRLRSYMTDDFDGWGIG